MFHHVVLLESVVLVNEMIILLFLSMRLQDLYMMSHPLLVTFTWTISKWDLLLMAILTSKLIRPSMLIWYLHQRHHQCTLRPKLLIPISSLLPTSPSKQSPLRLAWIFLGVQSLLAHWFVLWRSVRFGLMKSLILWLIWMIKHITHPCLPVLQLNTCSIASLLVSSTFTLPIALMMVEPPTPDFTSRCQMEKAIIILCLHLRA